MSPLGEEQLTLYHKGTVQDKQSLYGHVYIAGSLQEDVQYESNSL